MKFTASRRWRPVFALPWLLAAACRASAQTAAPAPDPSSAQASAAASAQPAAASAAPAQAPSPPIRLGMPAPAAPSAPASTQAAQSPSITQQAQSATSVLVTTGGFRAGPSMKYDPQIITTLLNLLSAKDKTRPSSDDFTQTSLADLIQLGTPEGFQLRNRYTSLGPSLVEAFSIVNDPRLHDQLLEEARWERDHVIRDVALIALASQHDPAQLPVFHEALLNSDPGVRFGTLEALDIWGRPEAKDEYSYILRTDLQPIIRIYAAQLLARKGDPAGLEELRKQLDSGGDWIARAMAANFLGDLGGAEDYDRMLNRISVETNGSKFALAEAAIAALKLFPKKSAAEASEAPPPPAPAVASAGASDNPEEELEPLVVTAPRLKIPPTLLIDGRVNQVLMQLLQDSANARPTPEDLQDPSIQALDQLSSPVGFLLMFRYTQLGFLLTEGLAGTADLNLRQQIITVAQQGTNPQIRASALLAVAYDKDPGDRGLFQQALLDQNITVRFGAMEALRIWNQQDALTDIGTVARTDPSLPVQAWAAAILLRNGDQAGRDILIRFIDNPDWLARAMAYRYLGELGVPDDFSYILFRLGQEQNLFVQSEMCGALLRLYARGAKGNQ